MRKFSKLLLGLLAKSIFFSIHRDAGRIFGILGLGACIYLA